MSYTFDSFDPDTYSPWEIDDGSEAEDTAIEVGAVVLYDSPCRLTLQGTAWTFDAHADRWLVELQTGAGSRVEWCAADRLRIICTAEVAAMCVEVAG